MMTTYTECAMKQEFLELQIPGIPMVVMVTSRARSLHDPTQQDKLHWGDSTSSNDDFTSYAHPIKLIPTTSTTHPVITKPQIYIPKE